MKINLLESFAWLSFFASLIQNNITLYAGLLSLLLSSTGILLNVVKIYKETQLKNKK
jgi:hypothetical protein